jgi:hypothetical protein
MKHIGTVVPILLLVGSMKLIEHKAATSPSYKISTASQIAQMVVKTSIDCTIEQALPSAKPFLFSAIPITYEDVIQDAEMEYGSTEIDQLDDEVECEVSEIDVVMDGDSSDEVGEPCEGCEVDIDDEQSEGYVATVVIDSDSLDVMLDKLKKLYLLKKLILSKPKSDTMHDFEPIALYQEVALVTPDEISYLIDAVPADPEGLSTSISIPNMLQ